MPLITEIAVTSSAGTAVQTISTPVWPWIGGPSLSSSGRTRNLTTEYAITAATSAKTPMQIAVVNQKTRSIPSRSFGRVRREPRDEQRDDRRGSAEDDSQANELDDRAPPHATETSASPSALAVVTEWAPTPLLGVERRTYGTRS